MFKCNGEVWEEDKEETLKTDWFECWSVWRNQFEWFSELLGRLFANNWEGRGKEIDFWAGCDDDADGCCWNCNGGGGGFGCEGDDL